MGTPPTIEYATLGMWDSMIIMVIALVVFGPRRLPQIGRQIGKLMYEFRKASNDFKFQMEEELRNSEEADRRKKEEELQRTIALTAPTTVPTTLEAPIAETAENPYASEASDPPAASVPVIQPPSTGEQVSAARPHMAPVTDAAAEANIGSDAAPSVLPDEPSEDQTAAEQATHHG